MRSSFPAHGHQLVATPTEAQDLAAKLGAALEPGDVVILDGPLGAGKTTFTQGIGRGMGVKGRITSPTFVIAREHRSAHGPTLIHVDAYRLLDGSGAGSGDPLGELDALDLDTDLDSAVVVAEWGGGLVDQLSDDYLLITIDRDPDIAADSGDDLAQPRLISWQWVSRGFQRG